MTLTEAFSLAFSLALIVQVYSSTRSWLAGIVCFSESFLRKQRSVIWAGRGRGRHGQNGPNNIINWSASEIQSCNVGGTYIVITNQIADFQLVCE